MFPTIIRASLSIGYFRIRDPCLESILFFGKDIHLDAIELDDVRKRSSVMNDVTRDDLENSVDVDFISARDSFKTLCFSFFS